MKSTFLTAAVFTLCFTAQTTQTKAQDVYVGGKHNERAVVWQNGNPTYLTAEYGDVRSVVVANGHVYAAGTELVSGKNVGKVWKDGVVLHVLTDGTANAYVNSIAVSGTDVYVAGDDKGEGRLWKNGVAQSGYTEAFSLQSVFVVGDSVYAAGCTPGQAAAAVWKNGRLFYTLNSGSGYHIAFSVVVDGNGDVYTAGWEDDGTHHYVPKVWKNNTVRYTLDAAQSEVPDMQLCISDGKIYVASSIKTGDIWVAKLWENGVGSNLSNGTIKTRANSVFVYDGNVYVAGEEDSYTALLWTNGTRSTISSGSGRTWANSVFVVPPVAQIGTTKYLTLDAALSEVNNGETINMLTDITLTEDLWIDNSKTFTLNTNHYVLDFDGNLFDILNSSKVTFDSCNKFNNIRAITVDGYDPGNSKAVFNGNLVTEYGIGAELNAEVTINGNISSNNSAISASNNAKVTVNGNITAYDGVTVDGRSIVVVNGTITAQNYISYYDYELDDVAYLMASQYNPTHDNEGYDNYFEYKCKSSSTDSSYVYVLDPSYVYIATVQNDRQLTVYPNPTSGELHISMSDMRYAISDMVIYDVFGRIQTIGKSEIGKSEINISHLPAGIYFLRIGGETVKVMKQ